MEWLRLIGVCLISAVMVLLLRQMQPQIAGLLSTALGILIVGLVLPQIKEYIDGIRRFLDALKLDVQYFRLMLKAMGIVIVTQLAVQACRDMEAPSIAKRAELCGRLALLGVAAPVFMQLTQMAVGILG